MKKGTIGATFFGIALVIGVICLFMCMERIPNGYVGVVFDMAGGVQDDYLTQGFKFISPTEKVQHFTISNEQIILTQDKRDDSKEDESFKVATADDASISVSFQLSYRFIEDKVVDTYKKFKGMDGEDIVNKRVKTVLRSKISEVTTDYTMMDIYSGNRNEINNKITDYLNEEFNDMYGIEVIDASIIDVHPDDKLKEAIDNRVQALQEKQQAEAEQEKVKVEAQTKLIQAENEAAIKVKQAEANRAVASSLTPELIDKIKYERWDGKMPTVSGGSTPIVDLTE